jgi:hypothetical protein
MTIKDDIEAIENAISALDKAKYAMAMDRLVDEYHRACHPMRIVRLIDALDLATTGCNLAELAKDGAEARLSQSVKLLSGARQVVLLFAFDSGGPKEIELLNEIDTFLEGVHS